MISIPTSMNPPEGDPKDLSPAQRMEWNNYVNFLEKKGYKGSPLLDKKETGLAKSLFDQYTQMNPGTPLKYEDIKSVQLEMQKLKDSAQGLAERQGNKNAKNIMTGVSDVDGWPGSKTTSFKFPEMEAQQFHNNQLTSKQNLGLVNSQLQPAMQMGMNRQVPKGVNLETFFDSTGKPSGKGYTDKNGDVVIVNQ